MVNLKKCIADGNKASKKNYTQRLGGKTFLIHSKERIIKPKIKLMCMCMCHYHVAYRYRSHGDCVNPSKFVYGNESLPWLWIVSMVTNHEPPRSPKIFIAWPLKV